MQTGLVWPMPGPDPVGPSPLWAETFRQAGFSFVRMDVPVSRDRANAEASVRTMHAAGLTVLPILSWPYAEPDVEAMCGFAEWYIETFPTSPWITLGNEPWVLDKIPGGEYLRIAGPMAETLLEASPDVAIILAMDLFDHVSGEDRGWRGVERVIECIASHDRYYADIHPYRNPHRPTWSPWGSRDNEWQAIQDRLGHDRVIYGEVGWKPSEGYNQASGAYHVAELDIAAHHGIPLTCVYTHTADLVTPAYDFGLWLVNDDHTLTPRAAADTLASYLLGQSTGF